MDPMVKFLPMILDKLIGLIISPPQLNGQQINCANSSFEALAMIVGTITVSVQFTFFLHIINLWFWFYYMMHITLHIV